MSRDYKWANQFREIVGEWDRSKVSGGCCGWFRAARSRVSRSWGARGFRKCRRLASEIDAQVPPTPSHSCVLYSLPPWPRTNYFEKRRNSAAFVSIVEWGSAQHFCSWRSPNVLVIDARLTSCFPRAFFDVRLNIRRNGGCVYGISRGFLCTLHFEYLARAEFLAECSL